MRIVILEDERPALDELRAAVDAWSGDAEIVAVHDSIADAAEWFRRLPAPDLVLADMHLTDGLALDLLAQVDVPCPVVFVTAHDEHTLAALEAGGVDYLLKPLDPARVGKALDKIVSLRDHFRAPPTRPRQRVLVRRASHVVAIDVEAIAWFCTEHRLVTLVTHDGQRHVVDKTLTLLASELSSDAFFRVGRGWLVSIGSIRGYRALGKGRLGLLLEPSPDREAVVSAEAAGAFRKWFDR